MVASCKKKDVHCLFDMDGFLSKPIIMEELIGTLQKNLEQGTGTSEKPRG